MVNHDLTAIVEGIIHEETQASDRGLDLTVAEVYDIDSPGRVDFGGGELEDAVISPHDRTWRNPEDDYQWWDLSGGTYLIEYNERLVGTEPLLLQTRDAVRTRGAYHPTLSTTDLDPLPLTVAPGGIRIKENARISTLLPHRT